MGIFTRHYCQRLCGGQLAWGLKLVWEPTVLLRTQGCFLQCRHITKLPRISPIQVLNTKQVNMYRVRECQLQKDFNKIFSNHVMVK